MTIKTTREFLNAVLALSGIDTAITEYAKNALVNLDKKNEKRANAPSAIAHRAEIDGLRADILAVFTNDPALLATAAAVAEKVGVSVPKASAALTALVKAGALVKQEIKIHACKAQGITGGKKMAYSLPPAPAVDEGEGEGAE